MSTDSGRIERRRRRPVAPIGVSATVRMAAVGALILGTLAACGELRPSGSGRSSSQTPSAPVVSSSPSTAPASTLPTSPDAGASSSRTVETTDPAGDAKPAFVDVLRLHVEPGQASISVVLSLSAAPPSTLPVADQLAYRFYLDTDGDGTWDHMAAFEATPDRGFVPVLVDRLPGRRRDGTQYPGTAEVSGQLVSMTVPFADIGCPSSVRVRARAEQTSGGATTDDEIPDAAGDWIRIETGCKTP